MKKTRRVRRFRSWRTPQLGVAAALAIVAALAVAGCGGSSSSSRSSSEEGSTSSSSEAGGQKPGGFEISEETRSCLKEQGVELPEPGQSGGPPEGGEPPSGQVPEGGPPQGFGGAGGEGGSKLKEAFEECGAELPQGKGKPGGAPTNSAAFRKSLQKYVACVRENGYELPEPNLSGEGPVFDESEVNQEDPEFKAASEKCQSLLRGAGGNGSSGEAG